MKRPVLQLVSIIILIAGCTSTSDKRKETASPVKLSFTLPAGSSFQYALDNRQTISQQVMGMNMTMEQHLQTQASIEVVNATDTISSLIVSYDHIALRSSGKNMQLEYDSRDSSKRPRELNGLGQLVQQPFTMQVSTQGSILKKDDVDREQWKVLPTSTNQSNLNDISIINMMEQALDIYPPSMVKPGDTWKKNYQLNILFTDMQIAAIYKLLYISDGLAHIQVNGVMEPMAGAAGKQLNLEVKGKQQGKLDVDTATGLVVTGSIEQEISGVMRTDGKQFPLQINRVTVIRGKKK